MKTQKHTHPPAAASELTPGFASEFASDIAAGAGLSCSAEILTLKKMKYFLAVADTGKITAAAHEIHISPAVITAAIRQMEDFLSVKLFDSRPTGHAPDH